MYMPISLSFFKKLCHTSINTNNLVKKIECILVCLRSMSLIEPYRELFQSSAHPLLPIKSLSCLMGSHHLACLKIKPLSSSILIDFFQGKHGTSIRDLFAFSKANDFHYEKILLLLPLGWKWGGGVVVGYLTLQCKLLFSSYYFT